MRRMERNAERSARGRGPTGARPANGTGAAAIRSKVRAAFADDDPVWLARLWPPFQAIVDLALGRLTGGGARPLHA